MYIWVHLNFYFERQCLSLPGAPLFLPTSCSRPFLDSSLFFSCKLQSSAPNFSTVLREDRWVESVRDSSLSEYSLGFYTRRLKMSKEAKESRLFDQANVKLAVRVSSSPLLEVFGPVSGSFFCPCAAACWTFRSVLPRLLLSRCSLLLISFIMIM